MDSENEEDFKIPEGMEDAYEETTLGDLWAKNEKIYKIYSIYFGLKLL